MKQAQQQRKKSSSRCRPISIKVIVLILCVCGVTYMHYHYSGLSSSLCPIQQQVIVTTAASATTAAERQEEEHRPINSPLPHFTNMPGYVTESIKRIASARRNSRATFIQIGANDGIMNDPLYNIMKPNKSQWIGILVEPQPELHGRLAVLHASDAPDWTFYSGALAPPEYCKNGTLPLCETRTPGIGGWRTQGQLNTINTTTCNSNNGMILKKRPCETSFENLIDKHGSQEFRRYAGRGGTTQTRQSSGKVHLDLLQIDVEGHEYDILKLIDWNWMKPTCIHYEHEHLHGNKILAQRLLEEKGYTILRENMCDMLACLVANVTNTNTTTTTTAARVQVA